MGISGGMRVGTWGYRVGEGYHAGISHGFFIAVFLLINNMLFTKCFQNITFLFSNVLDFFFSSFFFIFHFFSFFFFICRVECSVF